MANLFTYGSLMFEDVIYKLTKRNDYIHLKATLHGYIRKSVKNEVYPGIKKS